MSKSDTQNYSEKDWSDVTAFWRRLIGELEIKNSDDVLPEMRNALTVTEEYLKVFRNQKLESS